MQRFCPNCGKSLEQDEVFCGNCGTKVSQDLGGQTPYQQNPQYNYPPQQTPTPVNYQTPNPNNYQTPNPNNFQGQYQYNPGPQNLPPQNIPQYQPVYTQPKKSAGKKILKIVFSIISAVCILIVILAVIQVMTEKKPANNPSSNTNVPKPTVTVVPTSTNNMKPTTVVTPPPATTKPSSGKALAVWNASMNANARYAADEKRIYVDYSVSLTNNGTIRADKVNVYLDPEQNDPNAKYLDIPPETLVNENGPVASINSGGTSEIKTQYYYSNIEAADGTKEKLQDVANRYIQLPLLVEWQENGALFTQKLTLIK